jgi:hypothetical protein
MINGAIRNPQSESPVSVVKSSPYPSHYLRAFITPPTIDTMAGATEFRTGDLAEILSGPFQRRLSVVLDRYQESELWFVAVYYPSENCFVHTYLDEKKLKIIGHLEET